MRKMQTPESPLSFPASVTEVSWIGSALGCGAMVGNALIGVIHPYVGSRLCLLFVALPQTVSDIDSTIFLNNPFILAVPLVASLFCRKRWISLCGTLSIRHLEWRHVYSSFHVSQRNFRCQVSSNESYIKITHINTLTHWVIRGACLWDNTNINALL